MISLKQLVKELKLTYGWDVASGCIWNLSKVNLKLLTNKGADND